MTITLISPLSICWESHYCTQVLEIMVRKVSAYLEWRQSLVTVIRGARPSFLHNFGVSFPQVPFGGLPPPLSPPSPRLRRVSRPARVWRACVGEAAIAATLHRESKRWGK